MPRADCFTILGLVWIVAALLLNPWVSGRLPGVDFSRLNNLALEKIWIVALLAIRDVFCTELVRQPQKHDFGRSAE